MWMSRPTHPETDGTTPSGSACSWGRPASQVRSPSTCLSAHRCGLPTMRPLAIVRASGAICSSSKNSTSASRATSSAPRWSRSWVTIGTRSASGSARSGTGNSRPRARTADRGRGSRPDQPEGPRTGPADLRRQPGDAQSVPECRARCGYRLGRLLPVRADDARTGSGARARRAVLVRGGVHHGVLARAAPSWHRARRVAKHYLRDHPGELPPELRWYN